MKSVIFVVVLVISLANSFKISSTGDLECPTSGIKCTDETSFSVCSIALEWLILNKRVIKCPKNTICDENFSYPCVDYNPTTTEPTTTKPTTVEPTTVPSTSTTPFCDTEPNITKEKTEVTEPITVTKSTTELQNSTEKNVRTTKEHIPTEEISTTTKKPYVPYPAPKCTKYGNFPGPTCNSYYNCYRYWFSYAYELKNCPQNEYFDEKTATCVHGSC